MNTLKRYTFYWLDGKTEEAEGYTPADALRSLGYGGGALRALDYYSSVEIRPSEA